jgi:predicted acyltransferase
MFDPEGLLSTLPAIASALFGNVIGTVLISTRSKQQQLRWMITAGLILSVLGLIWSGVFPINKSLWSSSYVLWTSGLSFLVFAVCFALIEIRGLVNWSKPFSLLGKHAMLVYMLHVIFLKVQAIILVHNTNGVLVNLRLSITDWLFSPFSAKNASLCYALGYTLFWLFILKCITHWRLRQLQKQTVLQK